MECKQKSSGACFQLFCCMQILSDTILRNKALLILLTLTVVYPPAATAQTRLADLVEGFLAAAAAAPAIAVTTGKWIVYDDADCADNPLTGTCFGPNADTTYFYPWFDDGYRSDADPETKKRIAQTWKWTHQQALVVMLLLPPAADYFGFTPYLKKRQYPQGPVTLAASLGDSLNQLNINYTASPSAAPGAFNKLAALILSTDRVSTERARQLLIAGGMPASAINVIPYRNHPLKLGQTLEGDLFTLFLRVTAPEDATQLDAYARQSPLYSFLMTDFTPRPPNLYPPVGYKPRGSGIAEPAQLAILKNELSGLVRSRYAAQFVFRPLDDQLYMWDKKGLECLRTRDLCAFDNPDSIYTKKLRRYRPASDQDLVFFIGVDHKHFRKASYLGHNVANPDKQVSLAAVNTADFGGSVAYHTGLDSNDPLLERYDSLYVYAFGYDCKGLEYCLEIETADRSDNPKAIDRATGFDIATRLQLDPLTWTGPAVEEIVFHDILIACTTAAPSADFTHCLTQPVF